MLIEFPADDPARALRFWEGVLGRPLAPRTDDQGEGWQTGGGRDAAVGVHPRAAGPGDRVSLPYFHVDDVDAAVARVEDARRQRHPPGRAVDHLPRLRGQPLRARPAPLRRLQH